MTNHLQNLPLPPAASLAPSILPPAAPIASPTMHSSSAPRKNGITIRHLFLGAAGVALVSQAVLPPEHTLAHLAGEVMKTIYTQPIQRQAEIEALQQQLAKNRQLYAEALAEYQAFKAKCAFAILLDPKLAEQCNTLFAVNYEPQLQSLQSEINRLETELKNLSF
jgi:hypothetical protein